MQTTLNPAKDPEAQRLALKLVGIHHGELCKQVAHALFKWGRQSLPELQDLSGLPLDALRAALVILIQFNLVAVYSSPRSGTALYEADLPHMAQILRCPRFVEYTTRTLGDAPEWGPAAVAVVGALLAHGRLRLAQLPAAVGPEAGASLTALLAAVWALAGKRLIERVPPATLPPPPDEAMLSERAAKRRSELDPDAEAEAAGAARAGEAYQAERFLIPLEEDSVGTFAGGDAATGAGASDGVKLEGGEARRVTLWRVNYEEFNRLQRNCHVAEAVGGRHGRPHPTGFHPAAVAEAWLAVAAARDAGTALDARFSGPASIAEIVAEAGRRGAAADVTPAAVDALLRTMLDEGEAKKEDVEDDGVGEAAYALDVQLILNGVRIAHVLATLGARHGPLARHCWNLLHIEGPQDQRGVADRAMAGTAEVRSALYDMLRDGYVALQEVPTTADRAPSRTIYLWRAPVDRAVATLGAALFKTAANLVERVETERAARRGTEEMLELVARGELEAGQLDGRAVEGYRATVAALKEALVRVEGQLALVVPGG